MQNNSVIIHDAATARWLLFKDPLKIITTNEISEIIPLLTFLEHRLASTNKYAAGFLSYESAPAFDPAMKAKSPTDFPLMWFGIYDKPQEAVLSAVSTVCPQIKWQPSISQQIYHSNIAKIKTLIREGETYQINYSFRLKADLHTDPYDLFLQLINAQKADYGAFIQLADWIICCASPELFFETQGQSLISRPMKGTAPRALSFLDDIQHAADLRRSEKNQAENVMIVDMVRNDMSRIAQTGSVRVDSLFDIEKYPTLWQMTSSVSCRTPAAVTGILKAMFPAASITGAPKVRTTELIAELEDSPRNIYTGSIGFISPSRTQFNVAIRTVLLDRKTNIAEYGVGGGIVWDSVNQAEFDECCTKAKVLTHIQPPFDVLETMLWEPQQGYFLLERHLKRLADSAAYFSYPFDVETLQKQLIELAGGFKSAQKIRVLLGQNGHITVENADFAQSVVAPRVCLAKSPVNSNDLFLYHKTTNRSIYRQKLGECPGFDDVVLYNEKGEVTESTIANVLIEKNNELLTPPLSCGLLAGTYREFLLEQKKIKESPITINDIYNSKGFFLINSVRKMYPISLIL